MSTVQLATASEVMDRLRCGRQTLRDWERDGQLIPVRLGRSVRWRLDDLERVAVEGLPPKTEEA